MSERRTQQKRKTMRDFEDQILQIRTALVLSYPKCFAPKGQPKRPLKIGITKDLLAEVRITYPQLSVKMVRRFMADYCRGNNYLKEMKAGAARVDLNGSFSGFVTKEEAFTARNTLAELEKKQAEEKKRRRKMRTTALSSARDELRRLEEADLAASMSDNRYSVSGRMAAMRKDLKAARERVAELEKSR